MVWRNTTKWLLDLKHQQQDTIIFGLVARANGTRVNGDPTVQTTFIYIYIYIYTHTHTHTHTHTLVKIYDLPNKETRTL